MIAPFIEIANLRDQLDWSEIDWLDLADLWGDLPIDTHMADKGTYRRRRYSALTYDIKRAEIHVLDQQPFHQSKEINRLNGGVLRTFEPVHERMFKNKVVVQVLDRFGNRISASRNNWRVNIHQHRITATANQTGRPTPEGIHRDGVDFVVMIFVGRSNVQGGTSTFYDTAQQPIIAHTLTVPGEYVFLDDRSCLHSVSPIRPADPRSPGRRDMLFFEFTS